jgi:hypothetical protein
MLKKSKNASLLREAKQTQLPRHPKEAVVQKK